LKVLIVDDHALFAEAVQIALRKQGIHDVDIVSNGDLALRAIESGKKPPNVVIMDLGLPGQDGFAVGKQLINRHPDVKVIALTALRHPDLAREAVRSGFHGFLTKDMRIERLVSSIRAVAQGEVVLSQQLVRGMIGLNADDQSARLLATQLTEREREALAMLSEGATTAEIARAMRISRNTVRTHVQSILYKLGVHSRLEAAAFAVRHRIVAGGGTHVTTQRRA
jgi:two-component system, NarL family, nitrate/nitrite response regulator NarL